MYLREKSKEEEKPLHLLQIVLFTLTEFEKGISWESLLKAKN